MKSDDHDFFIVAFDLPSTVGRRLPGVPETQSKSRARLREIYRRFIWSLRQIGVRTQKSMYVVPKSHLEAYMQIKECTTRSLRRHGVCGTIIALSCAGKDSKNVLASVYPNLENQFALFKARLQRHGNKPLNAKLQEQSNRLETLYKALSPVLQKRWTDLIGQYDPSHIESNALNKIRQSLSALYQGNPISIVEQSLKDMLMNRGALMEYPILDRENVLMKSLLKQAEFEFVQNLN